MRYLKWFLVLVVLIFIILEIIYNISSLTQNFQLVFRLPRKTFFTIEMQLWFGLLIMFILGFSLAILLEIYFWFKYTMTIRKQNRIIQDLQKELELARKTQQETQQPSESPSTEQTKAIEKNQLKSPVENQ